jgi:hypothetical protein
MGNTASGFHITFDSMAGQYGLLIQTDPNRYHFIPMFTVVLTAVGIVAALVVVAGVMSVRRSEPTTLPAPAKPGRGVDG